MKSLSALAAAFLFAAVFCTGPLAADTPDPALISRLMNEGCPAIRQRGKLPKKLHLKWIHSRKKAAFEQEFYAKGKCYIQKDTSLPRGDAPPSNPHSAYYIRNRFYSFYASRDNDKPWTVGQCYLLDYFSRDEWNNSYPLLLVREFSPYMLGSHSLADYIKRSGFEITRIELVPDQETETIRFEFINRNPDPFGGDPVIKSGTVSLLPARDWGMSEITVDYLEDGSPHRLEKSYLYSDGANTFFSVKAIKGRETFLPHDQFEGVSLAYEDSITECDEAECPKAEFFPKFYGHPNPNLIWMLFQRYLLSVIGAVIILVSLYSLWRKRRAAKLSKEQAPDSETPAAGTAN